MDIPENRSWYKNSRLFRTIYLREIKRKYQAILIINCLLLCLSNWGISSNCFGALIPADKMITTHSLLSPEISADHVCVLATYVISFNSYLLWLFCSHKVYKTLVEMRFCLVFWTQPPRNIETIYRPCYECSAGIFSSSSDWELAHKSTS